MVYEYRRRATRSKQVIRRDSCHYPPFLTCPSVMPFFFEVNMNVCKHCGCVGHFHEDILEGGPHYGKYTCKDCGRFAGWMPKPKNEGKRGRNKHTAESMGIDHCQMCLRPKHRLGDRSVLEPHHVTEIQHGGEDIPENIWIVCTHCHRVIHHNRVYLNDHFKGYISPDELQSLMDADKVPQSSQEALKRLLEAVRRNESRTHQTAA